jgi:hypothetical protein
MFVVLIIITALAGLMVFISRQPADFKISRTLTMAASEEEIFGHINDLRRFNLWSPWAKMDPHVKQSFDGAEEGKGAIMRWEGNSKVGQGSMEIVQSRPFSFIQCRMEFLKPMKATNIAEFVLKPSPGGETSVIWTMSGTNNFISKAMNLVLSIDRMVGTEFEKGLANLKALVEQPLLK